MGVRTVVFIEAADDRAAAVDWQGALLWDSTSGVPLPIERFESADEADWFLQWLDEDRGIKDARQVTWLKLHALQLEWWQLQGRIA